MNKYNHLILVLKNPKFYKMLNYNSQLTKISQGKNKPQISSNYYFLISSGLENSLYKLFVCYFQKSFMNY